MSRAVVSEGTQTRTEIMTMYGICKCEALCQMFTHIVPVNPYQIPQRHAVFITEIRNIHNSL